MEVGLSPVDIVLNGDPAHPSPLKKNKWHSSLLHFPAHVYCGKTARWIKMPLGMEVGLGPGYIVLPGDPATPELHSVSHTFHPMSTMAK